MTLPSPALVPAFVDGGTPRAEREPADQRIRDAIAAAWATRPTRSVSDKASWGQGRQDAIKAFERALGVTDGVAPRGTAN
jgi:hypothetical protein